MYYLLLQAGSILELIKMFDDGKSCETIVISKSFVLFVLVIQPCTIDIIFYVPIHRI